MGAILDYDFHPPDDLRLFTFDSASVLRFDQTVLIAEAEYGGTILRHYVFADHWFKINVTADLAGNFVEEPPDSMIFPFSLNCDIATPMLRRGNAVFGADLWLDVLVRSDGLTDQVVDEHQFSTAEKQGWLSDREVQWAQRGLAELIDLIEGKRLVAFLTDLFPFDGRAAPPAIDMERVPPAEFSIVQPRLRPTWYPRTPASRSFRS